MRPKNDISTKLREAFKELRLSLYMLEISTLLIFWTHGADLKALRFASLRRMLNWRWN